VTADASIVAPRRSTKRAGPILLKNPDWMIYRDQGLANQESAGSLVTWFFIESASCGLAINLPLTAFDVNGG
jgi:hypothetical protein